MDIDECSTFTHSCHADSDCTNTMGSYDCSCKDGFTGDGLICIDIDECNDGTHLCSEYGYRGAHNKVE